MPARWAWASGYELENTSFAFAVASGARATPGLISRETDPRVRAG